MMSRM